MRDEFSIYLKDESREFIYKDALKTVFILKGTLPSRQKI